MAPAIQPPIFRPPIPFAMTDLWGLSGPAHPFVRVTDDPFGELLPERITDGAVIGRISGEVCCLS
jgi:hypothetical protein